MGDRTILHCDMNNFFASVELLDYPELADLPVAVCGNPENRHGIILAKNQLAKKCGVVTAETLWQAKQKCPDLVTVPPHHDKYKKYYRMINKIYERYTDMVEPFSIDESWLDVTASLKLFGTGMEIAEKIRNDIRTELGLTLSIGVSFNKIFAKMGSEYKKPDAITAITRDNYKELLWPMEIGEMFFVGSATAQKLRNVGINTIGGLAQSDRNAAVALLGKQGGMLHDYANGLDDAPVCLASEREKIKSVGNGMTFKRDLSSIDDVRTAVISLSDTVASRLRKYQMKARGVKVDIKDTRFKSVSRQQQLENASNLTEDIFKGAMKIIEENWQGKDPIRLITVTCINLSDEDESIQLSMFGKSAADDKKGEDINKAVDEIRGKFGSSAITFGSIINNDIGIDLD